MKLSDTPAPEWGGKRANAGCKPKDRRKRSLSITLGEKAIAILDLQENKSAYIEKLILDQADLVQ